MVAIGAATCTLSSTAAALDEPGSAPSAERSDAGRRWYGYELLIADGVVAAGYVAGIAADSAGLVLGSYAAFVLVPPVFHLGHSRDGAALGSLGLRLGVPLGAFYAGAKSCSDVCMDEAFIALGIGMLVASVVDVAWLAWERVPVKPSVSVTPTSVSVGASFAL